MSRSSSTPVKPWDLVVVEPTAEHTRSIVLLHGFQGSAAKYSRWWVKQCRSQPGCEAALAGARLVFVQSPTREVSCYGKPRPALTSWHDYKSDHGGAGGRPDVEEEINTSHLAECRAHIHSIIDDEIARLGDASRVALGGQSQGACTALDAALTHPSQLGGCFVSYGMLYSCTPLAETRRHLHIWAFHGASDAVIAPSLATRSFARLLDAGYQHVCTHVAPALAHCESSAAEVNFFCRAIEQFFSTRPSRRERPTSDGISPPQKRHRDALPRIASRLRPRSPETH